MKRFVAMPAPNELIEQIENILDTQAVTEVLSKLMAGTEEIVPFVRGTHRASPACGCKPSH